MNKQEDIENAVINAIDTMKNAGISGEDILKVIQAITRMVVFEANNLSEGNS